MTSLMELIFVGIYLQFVIVICMSSVFSSEYESGAASLLLTTKYGKDRMIWSKIAVSLLFTVGNVVISYLGMVVIVYTVISVVALLSVRRGFVKVR